MKNQYTIHAILGLGASLLMATPGISQVTMARAPLAVTKASPLISLETAPPVATSDDEGRITTPPSAEVQKRVRALLASTLPVWDARLLTSYETPSPWEDNLNYQFMDKLLGETPFDWEGKTVPPPDADRFSDDSKAMRIRRADGVFRYHSRKRVFTPDMKGKAAPSFDAVSRQMYGFLGNLRFPLGEAAKGDVQTQEMSLSNDAGEVSERFPTYAYFIMSRNVEGIPVEGSTVRASVNMRGEVQRMKIAWPHFKLRAKAGLRSRERVLEEAFQKVVAQDPTDRLELAARLVYAKSPKGDFLPAVQVDVSDGETPYRMTIPVAQ